MLLQQGKAQEAIEPLVRAAAINPNEQCSLLVAQAYQNNGQFKEAIAEYKKLDISTSQNKMIPFNLGLCLLNTCSNIDAIEAFKLAIKMDESFLPAWGDLGNALKNEGRCHEALLATQKVLDLDPDNPDAHMNLGGIYKDLGKLDQALASTLKSLELKPDNPDAHINLGGIYKDLGQLDQALAATLKSLELKPDNPTAHINLGQIYKNLGQLDQALAATLKSLELKPDNPTAHMNLGGIYKNLGNLDQALKSTLKSLELKPDNPTAHINLGSIYKDLGNLDQALTSTLKSLDHKPDNPIAHMNLGGIYKDLGNLDKAVVSLEEAMKNDKTNEEATIKLAKIYYYTGQYREGITALSGIDCEISGNILLSLYLCLNDKLNFNRCADRLLSKGWINPQGIAAIDHSNILYDQMLNNGLGGRNTIDSVFTQKINTQELSDSLIQEILNRLSNGSLQSKSQGHLAHGSQTSGNILDLPEEPFQILKKLLIQKIDEYNQTCHINTDKNFKVNWKANQYLLRGWAIIMNKGGNLKAHNHEEGWLTGTFYLQMPEETANTEEGAIEFSHQGPKYPKGNSEFERKVIRPSVRDLNIFCSSLFHRTLPFQSEQQRICLAFDVTKQKKS